MYPLNSLSLLVDLVGKLMKNNRDITYSEKLTCEKNYLSVESPALNSNWTFLYFKSKSTVIFEVINRFNGLVKKTNGCSTNI